MRYGYLIHGESGVLKFYTTRKGVVTGLAALGEMLECDANEVADGCDYIAKGNLEKRHRTGEDDVQVDMPDCGMTVSYIPYE